MLNQAWERAYFALVLFSATSCMHKRICKTKHSNWSNAKDSHRTSSVFRGSSCSSTGEVTGRCLWARRSVSPSCVLNSNLRSRATKKTMWKIGWQCKCTYAHTHTHTHMHKYTYVLHSCQNFQCSVNISTVKNVSSKQQKPTVFATGWITKLSWQWVLCCVPFKSWTRVHEFTTGENAFHWRRELVITTGELELGSCTSSSRWAWLRGMTSYNSM